MNPKKILTENFENQLICIHVLHVHTHTLSLILINLIIQTDQYGNFVCHCCGGFNNEVVSGARGACNTVCCRLKNFAKTVIILLQNFILICSSKIPRRKKRSALANARTHSSNHCKMSEWQKGRKMRKTGETKSNSIWQPELAVMR